MANRVRGNPSSGECARKNSASICLQQRAGHIASAAYAQLVNSGFEAPAPGSDVLENDGNRRRVVE